VVNPRADSSKGIPAREDREFAQLIVNAVGSHADLLAALDALFEHCAMVHKYWGECSNVREADAAIAAARAALTKARGQA
jgi:hypothetical protein